MLSQTDLIMHNTFWIGVYPGVSTFMVNYVIGCFETFFRNR